MNKNRIDQQLSIVSCALEKCLQYVIQSSLGYFGTHRRNIYPWEKMSEKGEIALNTFVDSSRIFFRFTQDIRVIHCGYQKKAGRITAACRKDSLTH